MKQNTSLLRHFLKVFLILSMLFGLFALTPATSGQPIARDEVVQLAWSPDGSQIAIAGGAYPCDSEKPSDHVLRILDVATSQVIRRWEGHSCPQVDVAWNSNGTQIVSSGFSNGETFIWDVATGTIIKKVRIGTEIGVGVFWRPNSTQIASIGSGGKYAFVWDSVTGEILYALPEHGDFTTSAAWSPDGTKLATGSIDQTVQLWDITLRQSVRTLTHPAPVYAEAWSPSGSGIVSGDKNGTVHIWNALTGQPLHTLTGHTDAVEAVSWSSDGSLVASGSDDGTIRVWDAATGELMEVIQSTAGAILDLAWSPTTNQLAYIGRDTGDQGGIAQIAIPISTNNPPTANAGSDRTVTATYPNGTGYGTPSVQMGAVHVTAPPVSGLGVVPGWFFLNVQMLYHARLSGCVSRRSGRLTPLPR